MRNQYLSLFVIGAILFISTTGINGAKDKNTINEKKELANKEQFKNPSSVTIPGPAGNGPPYNGGIPK